MGLLSLRRTAVVWQAAGISLGLLAPGSYAAGNATACTGLGTTNFSSLNTTILNATYYDSSANVSTLGTCDTSASINVSLCRIQFVVNTSSISAITAEAWLPDDWNERFLALGNGGLNGCIDYKNLNYGTNFGFASVASNNGHDGDTGVYFENNTEVLADFTSRSVHIETVVGKTFVRAYYGQSQNRSYYLGCSSGGRQDFYAALHYPEDFDGILAGSPATNANHLISWSAILGRYIGAPGNTSDSFITGDQWNLVSQEIMTQCDGLDGVVDGIITEPNDCNFRPEELLCDSTGNNTNTTDSCLTTPQVEALRLIYSPLYGDNNTLLYSRFEPGAENGLTAGEVFNGDPYYYALEWMKYVVAGEDFDFSTFWIDDIYAMDALDPGNFSTFTFDLGEFRDRGGKLISYHGRADPLISALNSERFYDMTAQTLGSPRLDDFYRLFLIPGMGHCVGGTGAVNFGQSNSATSQAQVGSGSTTNNTVQARSMYKRAQGSNIFLDLVNWVENGTAPDTITGVSDDGSTYRTHCRYPWRSEWDGSDWTCVDSSA